MVFNENKISSFRKIEVKTINNDFFIQNDKKILIRGNKFDATNLFKFFNSGENQNKFEKISNNIEIEFDNITELQVRFSIIQDCALFPNFALFDSSSNNS